MPTYIPTIPADTSRAAKAVYSQENYFLSLGDRMGEYIAEAPQFNDRFVKQLYKREQPSLALMTVLQFIEMLADSQAVEATRTRLDWKYALHLSLNYPGLPVRRLCEFRQWLFHNPIQLEKFQRLLKHLAVDGLLTSTIGQDIDSIHLLEEVCGVDRHYQISEAFIHALEALATYQPEWLRKIGLPHWYIQRQAVVNQPGSGVTAEERSARMQILGADSYYLLERFKSDLQPNWGELEEINELDEIWSRQYIHLPACTASIRGRCASC